MKNSIKKIIALMQGAFLRKGETKDPLMKDINASIDNLQYYGMEYDKKNISKDVHRIYKEINKATNDAKIKFGVQ